MGIPERVRINRDKDYYTHYIGKCGGGKQFMAFIVATLPCPSPSDWENHKRWYAVLHTFDANGNHLKTEAWYAGVTAEGEEAVIEKARTKRGEMLKRLGKRRYCNVHIKLFGTRIDGEFFGLENTTDDERGESVTLWPNDFFFTPPWDGSYST